jgi:hypothetical protein
MTRKTEGMHIVMRGQNLSQRLQLIGGTNSAM